MKYHYKDITNWLLEYHLSRNRKREPNRYSCSEIYAILNDWITPEEFISSKSIDFQGAFRMWQGTGRHKQLEDIMKFKGYEVEVKKEVQVGDLTIVGKADYLTETEVVDFKTSNKLYDKAKAWHLFQVKLYCTLFEKDEGVIEQPIYKEQKEYNMRGKLELVPYKLLLKEIGRTKRNDDWFMDKINQLEEFNSKVLLLNK